MARILFAISWCRPLGKGRAAGALLIAAMSIATPALLAAQDKPPDRERVYAARCSKCHPAEKLVPRLSRRSPDARRAFLERFLAKHYAPDEAERKQIVEFLSEAADKK